MAICEWCELDMKKAFSCTVEAFHDNGRRIAHIRWGREDGWAGRQARAGKRCSDCGARPFGFHHPGCDMQRCPACRRQMLTCGCRFDEDGPDEADESFVPFPNAALLDADFDSNGVFTEHLAVGDQVLVVHHDEVPEKDTGRSLWRRSSAAAPRRDLTRGRRVGTLEASSPGRAPRHAFPRS